MQTVCTGIVVPCADCKSETQDMCLPAIKARFITDQKLGWPPEVIKHNFLAWPDTIFKGQKSNDVSRDHTSIITELFPAKGHRPFQSPSQGNDSSKLNTEILKMLDGDPELAQPVAQEYVTMHFALLEFKIHKHTNTYVPL